MMLKHFRALGQVFAATHQGRILSQCGSMTLKTKHYSASTGGEDAGTAAGQTVVSERRGSVVTVAINRPEVRNAVNQETAGRLLEELQAFDNDPDLNVAVLHGKGVPLIDGGTVRLPRLIGLSRALDLIVTGRPIGAQEALAYGLANRVVPDGQALQAAVQLAEQISSFPQQCLRTDRSSAVYSCYDAQSFTQAMQYEFDHGVQVIQAEAIPGAIQFSSGAGRGGKFP
ncbi:uncharacterized protein zgc:101569 isoform X3 [Gambusia affinis]|uniref:uncharacterized protein zgc:101569 isoform X3 n=1 Tax=Gambusia affinis TaxID=33528 RepID=UPI001CDC4924|nr:uncharacterized protein zgc:101569 isoform X3 [Gambusia affinis]